MNSENDIVPVVVFSGSIWEAELLKSILEDAEIGFIFFMFTFFFMLLNR